MIVDLSRVLLDSGASIEIDGFAHISDVEVNGQNIHFTKPVKIKGSAKNISGVVLVEAKCTAYFTTQCSRCLEEIEETLEFELNEKVSKTEIDDEVLTIDSHEFDLNETVITSFGLELPINYLCSENCLGLCHECGCNLNHTKCDCESDNIDPRLAALKDFLK